MSTAAHSAPAGAGAPGGGDLLFWRRPLRLARWAASGERWESLRAHPLVARIRALWPAPPPAAPGPKPIGPSTDLEEMIEERPPGLLRGTSYALAALCIFLVVTAAVVHVEIIVQGSGQLTIDVPPIVIQPMERVIVRSLKVKVGDVVHKGQSLATLDATFAESDVTSLRARNHTLQAQTRRMEAEWTGTRFVPVNSSDPDEALQLDLLRQRRAQYESRLKAFDEELNRFEANAQTIDGQRDMINKQLAVILEIEDMRIRLFQSQSGSRMQLLEAQSVRLRSERELRDATDRLTELQFATLSKRADRQAFIDDWRRNLLEELDRQRAEAARVKEALVKAERMHDLVAVTAPEDGVVMDIAKRSVGSVLREAEPLMTIMPANAVLIAEILVSSADIGYAKIGDEVVIKVDAFPYQRHSTIKGRLMSIGEESFTPGSQPASDVAATAVRPAQGVFHRARIALVDTHLRHLPKGVRLLAGMTLSGEIKVGSRSVLSYFLYPVTRGLDESMREP